MLGSFVHKTTSNTYQGGFASMIANQGVQWFFFRLDEGDNPPVYMYTEAREDRFDKICDSYTDFITGIAKADSTILHRLFG